MSAACALYAEHLPSAPTWDQKDKEGLDRAFDTQSLVMGEHGALESALKQLHHLAGMLPTRSLLPDGFTFSNATSPATSSAAARIAMSCCTTPASTRCTAA